MNIDVQVPESLLLIPVGICLGVELLDHIVTPYSDPSFYRQIYSRTCKRVTLLYIFFTRVIVHFLTWKCLLHAYEVWSADQLSAC